MTMEQWEIDELARAEEHRRQQRARDANKLAAEKALAGDPVRLAALKEATSGLLPWEGWDPVVKVKGDESGEEWVSDV